MNPFITSLLEQKCEDTAAQQIRLKTAMTEAFRNRRYDAVAQLAEEGAPFTEEMLDIAVRMKDPKLALQCLQHGIVDTHENVWLKNVAGQRMPKK